MIVYGIRIIVEDENFPIVEYYDDPAAAEKRKEELIVLHEQIRQNNINWLVQFQGLTREQAEQEVEKTEVKIEPVGKEDSPEEIKNRISNLDKKSKLYYNIYIKDK